jgi:uncharacterized protein
MHSKKSETDLRFNVAQLLREEVGARRTYEFTEPRLKLDGTQVLRELQGKVRFTRTASGVLAAVEGSGVVDTECMRCLAPVAVQITYPFRDEFHSRIDVTTGTALPAPLEDDPFFIDEAHLVDLAEAIREYALMALPMQPLCRPECKGICAICGVDRNIETCTCEDGPTDDRFAVLKTLLT